MKKSFTLAELLVTIILLAIVVTFLFQTLNLTQNSSKTFKNQIEKFENLFRIEEIITKDFLYAETVAKLKSKDSNHILQIKTKHTLYNPFYQNITYVLSKDKNLYRVESNKKFDTKKGSISDIENAYISKVLSDVEFFRISKIKDTEAYAIYIKDANKETIFTAVIGL